MTSNRLYYGLKFLVDCLLIGFIFIGLVYFRFGELISAQYVLWVFLACFLPLFVGLCFLRRDYMPKIPRDALDALFSTVFTFLASYLVSVFLMIFLIPSHPSRMVLGLFLLLGLPGVGIHRYLFNRVVSDLIISEPHQILFCGAGEAGKKFVRDLETYFQDQIEIIGFLDDYKSDDAIPGDYPLLGTLDDLSTVCDEYQPDSVFVSISNIPEQRLLSLINEVRSLGLPVKILSDIFDVVAQKVTGGSMERFPVIEFQDTPVRRAQQVIKRCFDLLVGGLLVIFLAPVMGLIALAIKLESRGPVLFAQTRMKDRRERFRCLKFRTMYQDAEEKKDQLLDQNEKEGPIFKITDDPRITNVGRWLRRFSLDELPQLFNVLKGEMSLIGPRPPTPDEVEEYEPWQKRRLDGLPGMTGLWQVSGRSNLSFDDMCLLDIYYLENWSLVLDFKILLKTIPTVITGRGAY